MRSLSIALPRPSRAYFGLGDAGGLRGDTHAGSASGGYGGGGNDHGGNSAQTATQVRALEAAAAKAAADKAAAANAAAAKVTAEKAAVEKAATVKAATDRAGDVAQRPFNQAIAAGSLTPAGVVAYQEAKANIPGSTWLGDVVGFGAKVIATPVILATGAVAPVTGKVVGMGINSLSERINNWMNEGKWEAAAAESLGPDWGGSGPSVDQGGTSAPNVQRSSGGGTTNRSGINVAPLRTSAPQPMPSAPVGASGTMEAPAGFSSTTTNNQPAPDHGALLLGAGILAAKLLI